MMEYMQNKCLIIYILSRKLSIIEQMLYFRYSYIIFILDIVYLYTWIDYSWKNWIIMYDIDK